MTLEQGFIFMVAQHQEIITSFWNMQVGTGPCRTEFSDVGFDFIVVGTNKIQVLVNSIVQNLNYLAFATTGVWPALTIFMSNMYCMFS